MLAECPQENCTVATTGQCLLNHDPAQSCPHFRALSDEAELTEELLDEPEQHPRFQPSNTLTADRLAEIMGERYCTVIGIVGPPDSGKTAALVSTYLLLSHGRLDGFDYADSRSLMALDEISRGARRWTDGTPPEQMTTHTELSEDRAAGFLHLRIRSTQTLVPVDFLLPDLPGEWSTAMVEESRFDRLQFLERADVIWLMVDGYRLATPAHRQGAIHRTKLYLQRLREFLPVLPRIILVVTRADTGQPSEKTLTAIREEAVALGIELAVQSIASFSSNPAMPAGSGIPELIKASTGKVPSRSEFWSKSEVSAERAINTIVMGGLDE